MKLLFILSIGLDRPGPSVHILTSLIEGLVKKGREVSVILQGTNDKLPQNLVDMGVVFYPVETPQAGKNNFAARYISQLRYVRGVSKVLKRHADFDAVYVHSNTAQLAFVKVLKRRLKGAGIVLNVQDIFPENMVYSGLMPERNPVCALMAYMQHKAYRECDAVITLSRDMKRTLEKAGAENVSVIPLWSYGDAVTPVPDDKNAVLAGLGDDIKNSFRCVYAGNTGSMQNVEVILKAADMLKNERGISFIIVGDGARLEKLKQTAREKRLGNVVFLPMQPPELATSVYSMADVNLITLKTGVIKTAFPSKTTTCCAVGKPIIACVDTDSDYANTIRNMDNCRVAAADDAKGLCEAIRQIRDCGATASVKAREYYASRLSQQAGIEMHDSLFMRVSRKEK